VIAWLSRWPVCVAVIVVLAAAPALALLPHLRGLVSRNAVMTTFVFIARAPISGRLVTAPSTPGEVVISGSAAAVIRNERVDDSRSIELRAQKEVFAQHIDRLTDQQRLLGTLAGDHAAMLAEYRSALARDTEARIAVLSAEVRASEASLVQRQRHLERTRRLVGSHSVSQAALDDAVASHEALRESINARNAELQRLRQTRRQLANDLFLVDAPDGALQVQNFLLELKLRQADLAKALSEARADLAAVELRLQHEEAQLSRLREASVDAPDGVLVWRVHAAPGQFVDAGTPLFSFIDCRSLFLDIRIDDTVLAMIGRDHPVRFRLFGSSEFGEAHVERVRGSAALIGRDELATVAERGARSGQVLARVDDAAAAGHGADFCGVGRTAYAELPDIGLYQEFLRRLNL
jgi:multidrug resistance efflux pump